MNEFDNFIDRLFKQLGKEEDRDYKIVRRQKKDFGERLIAHLYRHKALRGDYRILIYHYKRKASVKGLVRFLLDFEKFFEKFHEKGDYYVKGGYFVTYGEYDKKEFRYILNKLDGKMRELITIKSLKEEKPSVKEKKTRIRRLSNRKKAMIIRKVGRCCYPNCDVTDPLQLEVHHIEPISEGGNQTEEDNLIVLCANHHKRATTTGIGKAKLRQYSVAKILERRE